MAVEGAFIGSSQLTFTPTQIKPGDYTFSVGTAGSTTFVLQTILPALGEEVFAGREVLAPQQRQETHAGHFRRNGHTRGRQQRGGEILAAEQGARLAAGFDDARPADDEGDVAPGVIE
ncbi:MAG: hypothetical protein NTU53_11630 [Planctomycetota bacterium]|nr:hypothetical protein [Planctomycetota bacterium]